MALQREALGTLNLPSLIDALPPIHLHVGKKSDVLIPSENMFIFPLFFSENAVWSLECYVCGEEGTSTSCDKFNSTLPEFKTECGELQKSCVGSRGQFHDVSGKHSSSLLHSMTTYV